MMMFLKVCRMVRKSHWHENHLFRRELIGHVIEEVVNRGISTKCICV